VCYTIVYKNNEGIQMIKFFIAVVLLVEFELNLWWWAALVVVGIFDIYTRSVSDDTNSTILNNQKVLEEEILKIRDSK
jgi:hypothetical protein